MLAVILTLGISALCGLDLFCKAYVEKHFTAGEEKAICNGKILLRKVHNKGFALNLGEKKEKQVRVLSGIVGGFMILYYVLLFRKKGDWLKKKGTDLMLAGGASNCYDRFARKYVVDYFGIKTKWKRFTDITFNLGDIFIFFGSILVLLAELFGKKER